MIQEKIPKQTKITEYLEEKKPKICFRDPPLTHNDIYLIIKDAELLYMYIKNRYSPLGEDWEKFLKRTPQDKRSIIENLYEAFANFKDYKQYTESMNKEFPPELKLDIYIYNAIKKWLRLDNLRKEHPRWRLPKGFYLIKNGDRVHPVFYKKIYPKCPECGTETKLTLYGNLLCRNCTHTRTS